MRQLCRRSSCSYSGRSVRHSGQFPDRHDKQSGHCLTKPRRIGSLLSGANEQDSKRRGKTAHLRAISDVIEQRSAEAILVGISHRDSR